MVSEKETAKIRRFVRGELRDEPDLSTLTLGILKKRYLARVGRESLSPEAGNYMKQAVKEELMKMQDDDENGEELETKKPQNKRKREEENDEVINEREDPRAKKSRCLSSSSSESEDKEGNKSGSEESDEEDQIKSGSEDAEREVKRSQHKTNGNRKQQMDSEDSTDEDINESEKKGNKSKSGDSPKGMVKKKLNATKNGEKESSCTSPERKAAQSDGENETDTDKSVRSEKINGDESSDDSEKEEKVSVEKKNNDTDSDSSSLPSLEDDKASGTEDNQDIKKKKTMKKEKSTRGQKNDDKAIVRLKRYIAVCGARQNYKKLLDGCHSVHSVVAVLNKTLQDLGVRGQPTIKKCKKVRIKREQAQELAGLDVSNIISTQGRPKRRGAWQAKHDPPSSTYLRTLNSGSESEEENDTHRGRRRATDWANLRGVISDDAESD